MEIRSNILHKTRFLGAGKAERLAILFFFFVILGLCGSCAKKPVKKVDTKKSEALAEDTSRDSAPDPAQDPERQLWTKLLSKTSCNLLHGCDAAKGLVALSPEIAARAAERLESDGGDRLWRFALARALVAIRNPRVQAWQEKAINHPQWLIRAHAAAGLGRNAPEKLRSRASSLLEEEKNPGVRIGIFWGLTLAREKTARKELSETIATFRPGPDIRVELVALDAIRNMSLVEALPFVRKALRHENFFVVRDAIKTTRSLLDRRSIRQIIPLLGHERKLVRDEALKTLHRLTGHRNKKTLRSFQSWCARNCDPEWPAAPTP